MTQTSTRKERDDSPESNGIIENSSKRQKLSDEYEINSQGSNKSDTTMEPSTENSTKPLKRKLESGFNMNDARTKDKLRQFVIAKKQDLISKALAMRERELREMLFLESGGNLLDFDENSPALTAALEQYHETHRLINPKDTINGENTVRIRDITSPKSPKSSLQNLSKSNSLSSLKSTSSFSSRSSLLSSSSISSSPSNSSDQDTTEDSADIKKKIHFFERKSTEEGLSPHLPRLSLSRTSVSISSRSLLSGSPSLSRKK